MRECRICGCTDFTPCIDEDTGEPCAWAAEDLCTFCVARSLVEVYGEHEAQVYIERRRELEGLL